MAINVSFDATQTDSSVRPMLMADLPPVTPLVEEVVADFTARGDEGAEQATTVQSEWREANGLRPAGFYFPSGFKDYWRDPAEKK